VNLFDILDDLPQIMAAWDAGEKLVADGKVTYADFLAFKTAVIGLIAAMAGVPITTTPTAQQTPLSANDAEAAASILLQRYAPWYTPT
jgi:hypothetical protein